MLLWKIFACYCRKDNHQAYYTLATYFLLLITEQEITDFFTQELNKQTYLLGAKKYRELLKPVSICIATYTEHAQSLHKKIVYNYSIYLHFVIIKNFSVCVKCVCKKIISKERKLQ